MSLSEYLLDVEVGRTLPSRHELARRANAGVGTLERAFDTIISAGAVELESVPGAGTTVARIDYAAVWRLAGRSILKGQLPLHMSVEMQAIEMALERAFGAKGLEIAIVYREGARRRLVAVERGLCDFAVMSETALEKTGSPLVAAHGFGPSSYYGSGSWFRLERRSPGAVVRVGADSESPDHVAMVRREFPEAKIISTPFRLIPPQIVHGALDATVWFGGMALPAEYLISLEANRLLLDATAEEPGSEAVVVAAEGKAVHHLLSELDAELLHKSFTQLVEAEQGGEHA